MRFVSHLQKVLPARNDPAHPAAAGGDGVGCCFGFGGGVLCGYDGGAELDRGRPAYHATGTRLKSVSV
jgi:hypothetical protein